MVKVRNIFTIFVIIFLTNPNFPWIEKSQNTGDLIEGNIINQIIASAIYLIIIALLISKRRYVVKLSLKNYSIWIVILWVFATFLWSGEPSLTLRRAAALLGTTLIGLFFASFYNHDQFTRIVGWAFLIISLVSLILIIFFPSQGIMSDPAEWMGIYSHKNNLGKYSLFGIAIFLELLSNEIINPYWLVGLVLSYVLLIGSKSTTSLLISVVVVLSWGFLYTIQNRLKAISIILIFFVLIILVIGTLLILTNSMDSILNILGKDTTLTGRTYIWELVLSAIKQRPWLGYGYGAVWLGKDYGLGSYIGKALNDFPVNAHNGYLDMCLEIGMIGAFFVSTVLISTMVKWISSIRNSIRVHEYQLWPIVFFILFGIINFTESSLLVQNNIAWVFITYLSFRTLLDEKKPNSVTG